LNAVCRLAVVAVDFFTSVLHILLWQSGVFVYLNYDDGATFILLFLSSH